MDHKRNDYLLKELKTMHTGAFQNIKPTGLQNANRMHRK
jgi:hypothetical protein